VPDTEVSFKPAKCGDESSPVVCHDLLNSSPTAQDFLKEEGTKGASGFCMEGMPFRPCSEGAAGLHDVSVPRCVGHKHSVDICLAEEGCQHCNCWWDSNFGCLADLALMAHFDVPPNIVS
jgi:hypothetical protein